MKTYRRALRRHHAVRRRKRALRMAHGDASACGLVLRSKAPAIAPRGKLLDFGVVARMPRDFKRLIQRRNRRIVRHAIRCGRAPEAVIQESYAHAWV